MDGEEEKEAKWEIALRHRTIDFLVVKRHAFEYMKQKAPEWVVSYTIAMFASCLNAANHISSLTDYSDKENYQKEIVIALDYYSEVGISDIMKDPYTKTRRKLIAILCKTSFPLACFIKKNLLKVSDR